MEANTETTSASGSTTPTTAQEQARLRRERRNAKIMAGGSSRLDKITTMSGRPAAAEAFAAPPSAQPASPTTTSTSAVPSANTAITHDDPAEVDISQSFYTPQPPRSQTQTPSSQPNQYPPDLAQMLAALNPQSQSQDPQGNTTEPEDPMLKMLGQMLGGAGLGGAFGGGAGEGGAATGGEGDIPPGLAQIFNALSGSVSGTQQQQQQQENGRNTDYIWRILHALFALLLTSYILLSTPFTGSYSARILQPSTSPSSTPHFASSPASPSPSASSLPLFPTFAAIQLILQSSRYFLDRGKLAGGGGGLLGGLGQLLPDPWGGYVRVWGRYAGMLGTVVADAMVLVFGMGVAAWWRGGVAV